MKLFLDSANIDEIRELAKIDLIDGVTTNPSLIKKSGSENLEEDIKRILLLCRGKDVSLEVVGTSYDFMLSEAKTLHEKFNNVASNVVIKIPVCSCEGKDCQVVFDSYKTIRELTNLNIQVNATLVFTPEQALMAAKAGAKYVSPFMGRADDYVKEGKEGITGEELIKEIRQVFDNYCLKTEVLAASIRDTNHFRQAILLGADIITAPYEIIKEIFIHDKTIEGVNKFKEDMIGEYEKIVNEK